MSISYINPFLSGSLVFTCIHAVPKSLSLACFGGQRESLLFFFTSRKSGSNSRSSPVRGKLWNASYFLHAVHDHLLENLPPNARDKFLDFTPWDDPDNFLIYISNISVRALVPFMCLVTSSGNQECVQSLEPSS